MDKSQGYAKAYSKGRTLAIMFAALSLILTAASGVRMARAQSNSPVSLSDSELIAEFRHDAPVLGAEAYSSVAGAVFGIELRELVGPVERHQVRQAITALPVKGAPMP